MKNKYFNNLCIKKLTNNISADEKKEFDKLIEESIENKNLYEKMKHAWDLSSPANFKMNNDLESEWNKLNNRIISDSAHNVESETNLFDNIKSFFTPRMKPALALSTMVVLLISSILIFDLFEGSGMLKTVKTGNNQRETITLSDGSIVTLNSGSMIEYYENFEDDKREIKLTGEAFFSVKKDGRPFIISTPNAVTTVLGTKFNVWARKEETRVIVKEGKVSLAENSKLLQKVILTEGETSKVIETEAPSNPTKVDTDYMLGWLDGKIVFNNTSLSEIIKELERNYNVSVYLENDSLSNYHLTGSFNNEEIDTVLSKICLALDLKYIEDNNNYRLTQ